MQKTAKQHLTAPAGTGRAENADLTGSAICPSCNDVMKMTIRLDGSRIAELRSEVCGCGYALTSASAFSQLAENKTLDQALEIDKDMIVSLLDGIPDPDRCCVSLPIECYRAIHAGRNDKR